MSDTTCPTCGATFKDGATLSGHMRGKCGGETECRYGCGFIGSTAKLAQHYSFTHRVISEATAAKREREQWRRWQRITRRMAAGPQYNHPLGISYVLCPKCDMWLPRDDWETGHQVDCWLNSSVPPHEFAPSPGS